MSQVRPVARTCLTCADARLHSEPAHRHRQHRAADAPHVRADAAGRDPRVHLADRQALGRAGRRMGARHPRRRLGRRLRRDRSTALPRRHVVERGADAEVAGHLRGLEGRPRRLGRHRARRDRRRDRRAPLGRERQPLHGCSRAGAPARAGHRPDRQLVEPGAVRQADRRLLGAQDRRRAPARSVLRPRHLPPDLPLRADLGLRRRRRPALRRAPLPDPAAGALRALRRLVHVRPLLRGAAADRPGPPHRRAAPERLGLDHPLLRLRHLLRLAPDPERR